MAWDPSVVVGCPSCSMILPSWDGRSDLSGKSSYPLGKGTLPPAWAGSTAGSAAFPFFLSFFSFLLLALSLKSTPPCSRKLISLHRPSLIWHYILGLFLETGGWFATEWALFEERYISVLIKVFISSSLSGSCLKLFLADASARKSRSNYTNSSFAAFSYTGVSLGRRAV